MPISGTNLWVVKSSSGMSVGLSNLVDRTRTWRRAQHKSEMLNRVSLYKAPLTNQAHLNVRVSNVESGNQQHVRESGALAACKLCNLISFEIRSTARLRCITEKLSVPLQQCCSNTGSAPKIGHSRLVCGGRVSIASSALFSDALVYNISWTIFSSSNSPMDQTLLGGADWSDASFPRWRIAILKIFMMRGSAKENEIMKQDD